MPGLVYMGSGCRRRDTGNGRATIQQIELGSTEDSRKLVLRYRGEKRQQKFFSEPSGSEDTVSLRPSKRTENIVFRERRQGIRTEAASLMLLRQEC